VYSRQPFSRRRALQLAAVTGAGLAATAVAGTAGATGPAVRRAPSAVSGVFLHGVASGDPLPDAVILWTRVTPVATATPGSGVGPAVTVEWEIAEDDDFDRIVLHGEARTGPERDHTVKVDARGLDPATTYWYRFRTQGTTSPAGRTRTAPDADADVPRLRMAVVSCANMQAGWFTAYRHLAERRDLDLVVHLGDYFYEYGPGQVSDLIVRPHDPPWETVTLADYRRRHAQYKADKDLQALHAVAPWVITWDDHESANDAWSGGASNHTPGAEGDWPVRAIATLIHSPQPGTEMPYNVDQWDGYGAERARLLGACVTTASPARCSSPVTSTPVGRLICPSIRTRIRRPARASGWSWCARR
jgi:alkaline phosphatase D